MDVKTPLLPTSASAPAPPASDVCCRHKRLSQWALVISVIALAHIFFHTHRCPFNQHDGQQVGSSPDAPSTPYYALDEGSSSAAKFCMYEPSDSWETITAEYTVPSSAFHGLDIALKDSHYINYQSGQVDVIVDDSIKETTVRFDLAFSDPEEEDLVEIISEEKMDGVLRLALQATHPVRERICMKADVTVTLSSASVLDTLHVESLNSAIVIHEGELTFSNLLSLSSANGHIITKPGVTGGKVILKNANGGITTEEFNGHDIALSSSNGHIDASIKSLTGNLDVSTANGGIDVNVASILGTSKIELSTSNGGIAATLPDSFESAFDISTIVGRINVKSDHPEKVHYTGSHSKRHVQGYYGDEDQKTSNTVKLTTVIGGSTLTFV